MATIRKEIVLDVPPTEVWDALRDFGAVHERLAAGFVTDVQLDGDVRAVTFFNGAVLHERFISEDAEARRLAWTIIDGRWEHHNGSAEVRELPDDRSCFVWLTDILPDETAAETEAMIDKGAAAIKETLERHHIEVT
jgi:Polyketide cyclase / dehydrase and lipid transport